MKRVVKSLIIIAMVLCTSCEEKKGYSIFFGENYAYVIMRWPSIGISGFNSVDYDGYTPSDIEKEIFEYIREEEIQSDYFHVIISVETRDRYGNYVVLDKNSDLCLCTLEVADVRRYAGFEYFKREIGIEEKVVYGQRYELKQNHRWSRKYQIDKAEYDEERVYWWIAGIGAAIFLFIWFS